MLEFLGSQTASALQNATLFGQVEATLSVVESQARYQTSVAQASALLVEEGTQSLDEVLQLLGQTARVDHCYYAEVQEGGQEAYWAPRAAWPLTENASESDEPLLPRVKVDAFPDTWLSMLQNQGEVHASLDGASPLEQQVFELLGASSLLALSVPGNAAFPGLLSFVTEEKERVWTKEELAALQTIAASLSSTLARESLLTRVQDALADTEILLEAGTALNIAQTYADILEVLLNYTILGQGAVTAMVQVYNHPWITAEDPPAWTDVLARWTDSADVTFSQRYQLSDYASLKDILHADHLSVIADVASDSRIDENLRTLLLEHLGGKGAIFVPLVVGGQWIGFISVTYAEIIDFSDEESRRLLSITAQASVAIQNRYQLDVTASRARREQLIREITGQIQAAPDVEGVLKVAARELGQALQTSRTFVSLGGFDKEGIRKRGTGPLSDAAVDSPSDD